MTEAAASVESKGKQATFAEFGRPDSERWYDDTYLFAYDLNGNVLLNPAAPSRAGNPAAEKDANGKAFHQALIDGAGKEVRLSRLRDFETRKAKSVAQMELRKSG